jgi:hypothetical protein
MDTQIIVSLITGLFGAVIAPLTAQVIIPKIKGAPMKKPKQSLPIFLYAGVGGVIGVLVGYLLVIPILISSCSLFASTNVDITSPAPNSSVPRLVTAQGTACHIPSGKELWLFVVPDGATSYYPQTGPIVISSGNWSASAYIGLDSPVDVGRGFVLTVALADQQGSAAIRNYFTQPGPEFKGIEPLPLGVQLMKQVRVVRK